MAGMDEALNKSLDEVSAAADELMKSLENKPATEQPAENLEKGDKPTAAEVTESSEENKDKNGTDVPGEGDEEAEKEDAQKSLIDELNGNETIRKSIDASAFLEEFASVVSSAFDGLRGDVTKSIGSQEKVTEVLAKSLGTVLKAQDSLVKSLNDLHARLDKIERQPVGRKSIENINVVEKSFNRSAGLAGDNDQPTLSKSETLAKMSDMVVKNVPGITVQDVLNYESGAPLRPEVFQLIQTQK